jgi:TonB-linked SusC/RagA family outer membrane protein
MHANFISKKWALVLILMLSFTFSYAQKQVSGSVKNAENQPVSGATVTVTGTQVATQTDVSGNFTITVPQGRTTLTITYVGVEPQTVNVANQSTVSVVLKAANTALEQVVVVGYGTQRRSDVTGAIGSVSAKEIQDEPVLQVGQALQGKVAGLQINQNSGAPGAGLLIRVRGTGTVNNADPLYVVDGNPNVNPLDINPDQIESIQVLKSASAAAIYGAQGANGVILITTKQGRAGKSQLDVNYSQGLQQVQKYFPLTNAREYAILYNEGLRNSGQAPLYPNPDALGVGTDWQKEMFQVAPMQDVSVSASGGSEFSKFFFSMGYTKQEGIIRGSSFDRLSLRINSSHNITPAIRLGQNLSASLANYQQFPEFGFGSILGNTLTANPEVPVKNADGSWGSSPTSLNSNNPLASLYYNNDKTRRPVLNGNVYADITVVKDLIFRSQLNFNYGYAERKQFTPVYFISATNQNQVSTLTETTNRFREYSFANTLTYNKTIGDHKFDVLAGITNQESYSENIVATGQGIPAAATENPNLRYLSLATSGNSVSGGAGEWGLLSYLGRINYNYGGKYFSTVNFRRDGSSRFGPQNRFGNFPSFSVGWKLSEEAFIKKAGWVNNLMLRGGWGSLGNQTSLPNYATAFLLTPNVNYAFGNTVVRGQAPTTAGNPALKWEATKETNVGFDFRGFDNKVTASFDAYYKKTTGMLIAIPLIQTAGYGGTGPATGAPFANGGSVLNKGIEIMLGYENRTAGGFDYNISGNISFNRNKVTELNNPSGTLFTSISFVNQVSVTRVGDPIASFWGYKTDGILQNAKDVRDHAYQTAGTAPGDWRFVDITGNDTINAADQTVIGSPWPKFTYGFNMGASYKGFDLKLQFQGTYGNQIFQAFKFRTENANFFNYTRNSWENRWTGEGTSNTMTRLNASDPNNNFRSSDYYVEDGSYLRLRNVQLSYRIPANRLKLRNARVFVSVQNALTFTKYSGFDPEIGTNGTNPLYVGIDETNYPIPRVYTLGINLGL